MRKIRLIAARDLKEVIATKGFWFGVLLFPIMMVLIVGVQAFIAAQAPTRYFVLLDQSGIFEPAVERALDRRRARAVMGSLHNYLLANLADPAAKTDSLVVDLLSPERLAPDEDIPQAAIDAFLEAGGLKGEMQRVQAALDRQAPEFVPPRLNLQRVPVPRDLRGIEDAESFISGLRPYFEGESKVSVKGATAPQSLDAAVFIPAGVRGDAAPRPDALVAENKSAGVRVWASNPPVGELVDVLRGSLDTALRRNAYTEAGVAAPTIERIESLRIPITQYRALGEAPDEEVDLADLVRQFLPVALAFLLFQALMFTVSPLLTNTVEEKSNRIIEVLLSSATPHEVMMGKLLSSAGMGAIVVATWMVFAAIALSFLGGPMGEISNTIFELLSSTLLLPALLFYFVVGYTMLSGIFLTVGGMCNTVKEAQNLMGPVMLVVVLPILSIAFIPRDPHGTLAVALSWFPFSGPFVMMTRITADPPVWEVIGTGLLMLVTAGGILWGSGKLFRRSILRSASVTGIKDLIALMKPQG